MPIVTAPSHHVPLLQLADLVVAATTAAVAGHPQACALGHLLLQIAHKTRMVLRAAQASFLWPAPDLPTNRLYHAFGDRLRRSCYERWMDPAMEGMAVCDGRLRPLKRSPPSRSRLSCETGYRGPQ